VRLCCLLFAVVFLAHVVGCSGPRGSLTLFASGTRVGTYKVRSGPVPAVSPGRETSTGLLAAQVVAIGAAVALSLVTGVVVTVIVLPVGNRPHPLYPFRIVERPLAWQSENGVGFRTGEGASYVWAVGKGVSGVYIVE
jgi:hypothetical protein